VGEIWGNRGNIRRLSENHEGFDHDPNWLSSRGSTPGWPRVKAILVLSGRNFDARPTGWQRATPIAATGIHWARMQGWCRANVQIVPGAFPMRRVRPPGRPTGPTTHSSGGWRARELTLICNTNKASRGKKSTKMLPSVVTIPMSQPLLILM
jgi:hypothetical protein